MDQLSGRWADVDLTRRIAHRVDLAAGNHLDVGGQVWDQQGRGGQPGGQPAPADRSALNAVYALDRVRPLRGVMHTPIVRRDGSVLAAPGYDEITGLAYLPPEGLTVPAVPEEPTEQDVRAAVALLDEMVAGFEFSSPSDKANYYGALLTPLLRELVPPPYKALIITAPNPGSGKTLLASVLRIIHGGVFRTELPGDADELRKMISTILETTSGAVIHIDNVTGVVRSSVLAGLLTSRDWSDRRLGVNGQITATNDRFWTLTGNNAAVGGDLLRRSTWVTIDPRGPDPHLRTGFAITDLEGWTAARRGELLAALLTLVRAWVAAGSPHTLPTGDTYKRWIGVVRGILGHAGVPGTFDDRAAARQDVGADDEDWSDLLTAVHDVFGDRPWTVAELLGKVREQSGGGAEPWAAQANRPIPLDALPAKLIGEVGRSRLGLAGISKQFGHWLRNRDGRWAGGLSIRSAGADGHRKVKLWKIAELARRAGCARESLSRIEGGVRRPSETSTRRLAQALRPTGSPVDVAMLDVELRRAAGPSLRVWNRRRPWSAKRLRVYGEAERLLDARQRPTPADQVAAARLAAALAPPWTPPDVLDRSSTGGSTRPLPL